jgi:hypothetical protein
MRPLIKVTLYDATSENHCTLLEEVGEYFVNFGNRTCTYREFLRMILRDDRLYPDLVAGDAAASFPLGRRGNFRDFMTSVGGRTGRPAATPYCQVPLDLHARKT